ncbi:sigma-70 family RNA polymerase sigma factor [Blastococcus sp. CT_GayMR20]|uniref:RNA polymerase sigma factor n=1 Tax=Blastococcus sp. CT_GayMR20 TaxID=2559609 RepID=UPI0010746197|nr:sigma-70 family RNA polymerase sigma factor [Blastococcus sp. CT_GayMR20]TFV87330.1 sigma-70 family RNA polymerase sigma factor [Blastococcus sp. CT_GayMR20]
MTAAQRDPARGRRFEDLAAAVYEPLLRYLRRRTDPATTDDVLGDVLLVLWRRLEDVPPELPRPYAYGVARGCLANSRRGTVRQERVAHRLARQRPDGGDPADGVLTEALDALPQADRELLCLRAWEQLPPRGLRTRLSLIDPAAAGDPIDPGRARGPGNWWHAP